MPQEACVEMKLKTKPSLVKLLQFVYCMENRNECIFDEETCKVSLRNYMTNILKDNKVAELYSNNKFPSNDIPNLKSLGIGVIILKRDANNNDNEQVLDEINSNDKENVLPTLIPQKNEQITSIIHQIHIDILLLLFLIVLQHYHYVFEFCFSDNND